MSFFLITLIALLVRILIVLHFDVMNTHFWQVVFGVLSIILLGQTAALLVREKKIKFFTTFFLTISPWHLYLLMQELKYSIYFCTAVLVAYTVVRLRSKTINVILIILVTIMLVFSLVKNLNQLTNVPTWLTIQQRGEHGSQGGIDFILHNKAINYSLSMSDHYFEHFSGRYFFVDGDQGLKGRARDFGLFYISDLIWLILGIIFVFRNYHKFVPLICWVLLSPLWSVIKLQPPDSMSGVFMLAPITIINAIGLVWLIKLLQEKLSRRVLAFFVIVISTFVILNIGYFIHNYFLHTI